jgi:hypothetical protein
MRESISTLRRRLTREEAIAAISRGFAGAVRQVARGPLRSLADVYIPYGVYKVTVRRGARREVIVLGIDLVGGVLDLYRFDRSSDLPEIEQVSTRNHMIAALSRRGAEDALRSRVKRLAHQQRGFLAAGEIAIDLEPIGSIVHVPYWAGFFGRAESASLVVLDALRGSVEGAKLRQLVSAWLTGSVTSPDPSSTAQAGARP